MVPGVNGTAGVKRIVSAFKRLRQETFWKVASNSGAWVVEVTGSPGRWHIHIHALIVGDFMKQAIISNAWKKLTDAPVVHIKAISVEKGVGYVTKYISKGNFHPDYVEQVAYALKSVRLFNVFGQWHNSKAPKVKLVCTCKRCQGTRWYPTESLFPISGSILKYYLESLHDDWLRRREAEGG